jgi:hypothetical protein
MMARMNWYDSFTTVDSVFGFYCISDFCSRDPSRQLGLTFLISPFYFICIARRGFLGFCFLPERVSILFTSGTLDTFGDMDWAFWHKATGTTTQLFPQGFSYSLSGLDISQTKGGRKGRTLAFLGATWHRTNLFASHSALIASFSFCFIHKHIIIHIGSNWGQELTSGFLARQHIT